MIDAKRIARDEAEARRLLRAAKAWEQGTGLDGGCFRAYALWLRLKHRVPELEGPG